MKYRRLGTAGMKVSELAFGGWINFGEGRMPSTEARHLINTAYDQGINFFDIADIYRNGEAETQMGAILRGFARNTLVISSKVYWPMSDHINDRGLSRKHLFESIDNSLKRLGTDYLDIYFCHRFDKDTPLLETVRAMNDLVQQGKILYWGTSEWRAEQIAEACALCDQHGYYKPQTEQPQYSLLHRKRVEETVLPVTTKQGLGLVVWSPLGQGMLTGKYDAGIPEDSRLAKEEWVKDHFYKDGILNNIRATAPLAEKLGITRSQLALAWVLRQTGVSSAIIGATKPEQILDNVKAADVELVPEIISELDALFDPQKEAETF